MRWGPSAYRQLQSSFPKQQLIRTAASPSVTLPPEKMWPGRSGQIGEPRALDFPMYCYLNMTCRFCLWPSVCKKSLNFLYINIFIFCTRTANLSKYHKEVVLFGQPRCKTRFLKIFTSIVYIPEVFQIPSGEKFTGPLINRTDRPAFTHSLFFPSVNALCRHFFKSNHQAYKHFQTGFLLHWALKRYK